MKVLNMPSTTNEDDLKKQVYEVMSGILAQKNLRTVTIIAADMDGNIDTHHRGEMTHAEIIGLLEIAKAGFVDGCKG